MSNRVRRVLVCGGRDYTDFLRIAEELNRLDADRGPFEVIIEGGQRGADRMARRWAYVHCREVREYAADWLAHGPAAGPVRNGVMLKEGKPELVIAFPGGRGTADMIGRAKRAGIEVIEVKA